MHSTKFVLSLSVFLISTGLLIGFVIPFSNNLQKDQSINSSFESDPANCTLTGVYYIGECFNGFNGYGQEWSVTYYADMYPTVPQNQFIAYYYYGESLGGFNPTEYKTKINETVPCYSEDYDDIRSYFYILEPAFRSPMTTGLMIGVIVFSIITFFSFSVTIHVAQHDKKILYQNL